MARWAEYFEQLFTMDPPSGQIQTEGFAVAKLRGGMAAGICNISAELLKAGGEAMILGLDAVLTSVAFRYHSSLLEEGVGRPCLEGERGPSRLQ